MASVVFGVGSSEDREDQGPLLTLICELLAFAFQGNDFSAFVVLLGEMKLSSNVVITLVLK